MWSLFVIPFQCLQPVPFNEILFNTVVFAYCLPKFTWWVSVQFGVFDLVLLDLSIQLEQLFAQVLHFSTFVIQIIHKIEILLSWLNSIFKECVFLSESNFQAWPFINLFDSFDSLIEPPFIYLSFCMGQQEVCIPSLFLFNLKFLFTRQSGWRKLLNVFCWEGRFTSETGTLWHCHWAGIWIVSTLIRIFFSILE